MKIQEIKLDIVVFVSSIVFNIIMTLIAGFIETDSLAFFGLFLAPLIGGVVRSALIKKKFLLGVIPGMFLLDVILFVPIIVLVTGYDTGYIDGMGYGLLSGGVMVIASIVALGVRFLIELLRRNKNPDSNQLLHDTSYIEK